MFGFLVSPDLGFSIPRPQCPGSGLLCGLAGPTAHLWPSMPGHLLLPSAPRHHATACPTHPHTSNISFHDPSNIAVGNAPGCEVFVATDGKDDRSCDRRVTAFLRGGGEGRRTQCSRLRLNFAAKARSSDQLTISCLNPIN